MGSDRQWLRVFFEEKALENRLYTVESAGGTTNLICTEEVVSTILDAATEQEAEQIANIVRRLDFLNADLHPFLEHLAQAIAIDIP